MAPKAIHLKKGVRNIYVTVEQLFEAAFGPSPREYQLKSLLGWRPIQPGAAPEPIEVDHKRSKSTRRPKDLSPGVKVFETDEMIVVEVELPPIEEESLYLEISGDLLIIRGNRVSPNRRNHPNSPKQRARKIYRYVQLPVVVRPGEVRARLEGNTVRVMISKLDEK